jgi:hypothetical protein
LIHKKKLTTKDKFQLNDLKEELSGVSNPNKEIAGNIIKNAVKTKLAMNELAVEKRIDASERKTAVNTLQAQIKRRNVPNLEQKQKAVNTLQAQIKRRNEQERVIKNAKQEIRDIDNKKITRGTTEDRANRILTLNKGIEIIQNKMAVRPVGRPRKSNAMSELEKHVSGQLLSV